MPTDAYLTSYLLVRRQIEVSMKRFGRDDSTLLAFRQRSFGQFLDTLPYSPPKVLWVQRPLQPTSRAIRRQLNFILYMSRGLYGFLKNFDNNIDIASEATIFGRLTAKLIPFIRSLKIGCGDLWTYKAFRGGQSVYRQDYRSGWIV